MQETIQSRRGSWWALSPLVVFLCLYLVTSLLMNDFYKMPITVAFLFSSCYAVAITRGLKLEERIYHFSAGASNKNILMMIWIFVLAGAFAQSAKQMGAIDATVNLTLHSCRTTCCWQVSFWLPASSPSPSVPAWAPL